MSRDRVPLHWEALADLQFRIVPLIAETTAAPEPPEAAGDRLAGARLAVTDWARRWDLQAEAQQVGAALAMYWHLEPDGAREFFIPRHIQSQIEPHPEAARRLVLPAMGVAAERLQKRLKAINERGCLLLAERDNEVRGHVERLGAVDSVVVLQAGRGGCAWVLFRFLGYDRSQEPALTVSITGVEHHPSQGVLKMRVLAPEPGRLTAEIGCHPIAWNCWVQYRADHRREFAELDEQIYGEQRARCSAGAP